MIYRFTLARETVELRADSEADAWARLYAARPGAEVGSLRSRPIAVESVALAGLLARERGT